MALRLCNYNDLVAAATWVEHDNLAYHCGREEAKASSGPQRNNNNKKDQNFQR